MIKSIQHFEEKGIANLEKAVKSFIKDPTDMAKFVYSIKDIVIRLGLDIIEETFTDCNDMLRDSEKRLAGWTISRTDKKKLITSLGTVEFDKTLFKNRKTGETEYLLDRIMNLDVMSALQRMQKQRC